MSHIQKKIDTILPNKKVYYRLQDLIDSLTSTSNKHPMLMSIEKQESKREYCAVTINELEFLYQHWPRQNRSFYECITEASLVKTYIDFEYPVENNSSVDHHIALLCILKMMYFSLNNNVQSHSTDQSLIKKILEQFLVLDA
jgi:hypothetical protein